MKRFVRIEDSFFPRYKLDIEKENGDEEEAENQEDGEGAEEEKLEEGGSKKRAVSRKGLREKLLALLTLFGFFKRPQNLPQSDRLKEIYYRYCFFLITIKKTLSRSKYIPRMLTTASPVDENPQ